jgi:dTDP-4-dehydrorhamnose 3,5-epimerase
VGVELSADNKRQLWVPPGFAHAFLDTSESAEFLHKTSDSWYPAHERRLFWCNLAVGIRWPVEGESKLIVQDAHGKYLSGVEIFE